MLGKLLYCSSRFKNTTTCWLFENTKNYGCHQNGLGNFIFDSELLPLSFEKGT